MQVATEDDIYDALDSLLELRGVARPARHAPRGRLAAASRVSLDARRVPPPLRALLRLVHDGADGCS